MSESSKNLILIRRGLRTLLICRFLHKMINVSEMCLEESIFMSINVGSIGIVDWIRNMLRNRDIKRPAYLCQGNACSVKFYRSLNYSPNKKKSMF